MKSTFKKITALFRKSDKSPLTEENLDERIDIAWERASDKFIPMLYQKYGRYFNASESKALIKEIYLEEMKKERNLTKPILDVACGGRMFYWDKNDPRVLFNDIRSFEDTLCDGRTISVNPDTLYDFTDLQLPDETFRLVVYDPPHLVHAGNDSWLARKYGKLPEDWQPYIRKGFDECMRVLKQGGTLIVKWSTDQISAHEFLNAIGQKPVFGTRRQQQTCWYIYFKEEKS